MTTKRPDDEPLAPHAADEHARSADVPAHSEADGKVANAGGAGPSSAHAEAHDGEDSAARNIGRQQPSEDGAGNDEEDASENGASEDDNEEDGDEASDDDDGDHETEDRGEEDDDESEDEESIARTPARPLKQWLLQTALFIAAVCLLDAMVNVRYPLDEAPFWYLLPSTDIAVILLNFVLMGFLGSSVPRSMLGVVVAWLFLVRLLRLGDGALWRYFGQRFNLYSDFGLVGDGFRFIHSTWPLWKFAFGAVAGVALVVGLAYAAYRALEIAQAYLHDRRQMYVGAALLGIAYAAVATTPHDPLYDAFYAGGFAASAMPRLEEEVAFFWNVRGQKSAYAQLIGETEQMLRALPSDLAKLHGVNVHLILVESYGRTMFELPAHVRASSATYDAFEQDLRARGFTIATGLLNSTTYGGQSWLAHSTLGTGIPIRNQLEYEIVTAKKPLPIASFFHRAGYRTVLAQPNTTRAWPAGEFYNFEAKYYNSEFGYRGPKFAWATMPDQYVLDLIRRRELVAPKRPVFVQYVLVSSHAPWAKLPSVVEDFGSLGDGSIYNRLPIEEFPIVWPHFEHATEAYGKSIVYDFEVLQRFIGQFITDGSLIIILGDHQPVAEVNGNTDEMGVPVHILSKNPELVRPFVTRGFQPGMRPNLGAFPQGLETLLPNLLVDFSTELPAH